MQRKRNKLGAAALILILTLILAVGTAFGRYRTELSPFSYLFAAREPDGIGLWGGKDTAGNYLPLDDCWTVTQEGSKLSFLLCNGTEKDHASGDLAVYLRLAATPGIQDPANLTLTLTVGEETYPAKAVAIKGGSELYSQFGDGWVYCFCDEAGEELVWQLPGGTHSELLGAFTLSWADDELALQPSMVQIQVTAVDNG